MMQGKAVVIHLLGDIWETTPPTPNLPPPPGEEAGEPEEGSG
jgi:hypothetical protein